MLSLSNCGQIRISRGDNLQLPIQINQGDSMNYIIYHLDIKDEVYFGVMEPNQPWEFAIIRKKYKYEDMIDGTISINLKPEDTMNLLPGLYYYQVKVRLYDDSNDTFIVNTIIPKTQFWIEE